MSKNEALFTKDFSDELLESARNCLQEKEEEIDYFVDSWQMSYRTAQINILAKYLCEGDITEAKKLLEQVQTTHLESDEQIQETERMIDEVLKDPYTKLVEQLTLIYEAFCKDYNLDADAPIPEKLKDTIIFEFSKNRGEKHRVSLYIAHFLLKSPAKIACRNFFISATGGDVLNEI